jgi:Flp pilus assembly protein TadB
LHTNYDDVKIRSKNNGVKINSSNIFKDRILERHKMGFIKEQREVKRVPLSIYIAVAALVVIILLFIQLIIKHLIIGVSSILILICLFFLLYRNVPGFKNIFSK